MVVGEFGRRKKSNEGDGSWRWKSRYLERRK